MRFFSSDIEVRGSIRCTTWTSTLTLFDALDLDFDGDVFRDALSSVGGGSVADVVAAAAAVDIFD
jgi:hypothetical protein